MQQEWVDARASAIDRFVADEFESLRRSLGQRFRWLRFHNERAITRAMLDAGLLNPVKITGADITGVWVDEISDELAADIKAHGMGSVEGRTRFYVTDPVT